MEYPERGFFYCTNVGCVGRETGISAGCRLSDRAIAAAQGRHGRNLHGSNLRYSADRAFRADGNSVAVDSIDGGGHLAVDRSSRADDQALSGYRKKQGALGRGSRTKPPYAWARLPGSGPA